MQKGSLMKNVTLFITGATRGIGKEIALRAAAAGANIVVAAKTTEPNSQLPGTIYSVAEEIEAAGGKALPMTVDVRYEEQVAIAVDEAVKKFGGIDILINNASAISLSKMSDTPMKKFDLMQQINARGTFLCSKLCLPHLKKSSNPHILTLSPPLNLTGDWFKDYFPYTLSKYGMSLCVLGMTAELKEFGIGVNALWPKYLVATAATFMLAQGHPGVELKRLRKPEIVADAAFEIINRKSSECTGNFFLDEDVLRSIGKTDFSSYMLDPAASPILDLFLNHE
jgi:citronellol/citronellal dehydrogenase